MPISLSNISIYIFIKWFGSDFKFWNVCFFVFYFIVVYFFHSDTYVMQCRTCGRYYPDLPRLTKHRKNVCGKLAIYDCSVCPYTTNSRDALKAHVQLMHKPKGIVYTCKFCSYSSEYENNYIAHVATIHQSNIITWNQNLCKFCNKVYLLFFFFNYFQKIQIMPL